jgi:hypothetical protein
MPDGKTAGRHIQAATRPPWATGSHSAPVSTAKARLLRQERNTHRPAGDSLRWDPAYRGTGLSRGDEDEKQIDPLGQDSDW